MACLRYMFAVCLWGWMAFASWWPADLLVLRSQMRDVRLDPVERA